MNKAEFYMNVMHHHMEDILQETKQPTRFSNQVSKGTTDMEFSFIAPRMHKRLQREVFYSLIISSLENTLLKFGGI